MCEQVKQWNITEKLLKWLMALLILIVSENMSLECHNSFRNDSNTTTDVTTSVLKIVVLFQFESTTKKFCPFSLRVKAIGNQKR